MTDGQGYILIADDNADSRLILSQMLTSAGYVVKQAEDGATALQQIEQEKPRLILLDLMMPGMSGFEVLNRLQRSAHLRSIPVIVLSAYFSGELSAAQNSVLRLPGVAHVVPKASFRIHTLLALVKDTLEVRVL